MKRSFGYLVVLTLLAISAVMVFAPKDRSSGTSVDDALLLADISTQINDVNRVEIVSAGQKTVATLSRSGDNWTHEQMGGYSADWSKLQALLAALAQARVIETKTDKPEYYTRLGVEDVASESAGSVQVNLGFGDQTRSVLIGQRAQGRQGQFVRLQDSQSAALVDRVFEVPTDPLEWADTRIIDINSSEVAQVEIIHPQGERVFVIRISADQTDFDLVGLPQDREIKSSWAVNSLGSVLSLLTLESVHADSDLDWSDAVKMRVLLFSGVEIMADVLQTGETYMLRLHASNPRAKVVKADAESTDASVEQQDIDRRAAEDVAKAVDDINRRTEGWVYGISKQKYDAMVKKPEDLLKPVEST